MISLLEKPLGADDYDLKMNKIGTTIDETFIDRCLSNHYTKFGGTDPAGAKNGDFLQHPAVRLKLVAILSLSRESPICHYQDISLATGNYDFYTPQY